MRAVRGDVSRDGRSAAAGWGLDRAERRGSGRGWAKQSGVDDANDVVCRSTGLEERAHSLMLLTGATRRG